MFWSKSHIHSLGLIHRNEAVNLSDDQTVEGVRTMTDPQAGCGPSSVRC
jgi:hypothetical protein